MMVQTGEVFSEAFDKQKRNHSFVEQLILNEIMAGGMKVVKNYPFKSFNDI